MLIFIEEEFGWRHWRWDYPGSESELRLDWRAGRIPPGIGYVSGVAGFRGTIEEVEPAAEHSHKLEDATAGMSDAEVGKYLDENEELLRSDLIKEWGRFLAGFDAKAHIHEDEDTTLTIGDETLPWVLRTDYAVGRDANPLPKERR